MDCYDSRTVTFISSERFENLCWDLAVNLVNKGAPKENNVWRRKDVSPLGFLQSFLLSFAVLCAFLFLLQTQVGTKESILSKMLLIMCPPSLGKAKI